MFSLEQELCECVGLSETKIKSALDYTSTCDMVKEHGVYQNVITKARFKYKIQMVQLVTLWLFCGNSLHSVYKSHFLFLKEFHDFFKWKK